MNEGSPDNSHNMSMPQEGSIAVKKEPVEQMVARQQKELDEVEADIVAAGSSLEDSEAEETREALLEKHRIEEELGHAFASTEEARWQRLHDRAPGEFSPVEHVPQGTVMTLDGVDHVFMGLDQEGKVVLRASEGLEDNTQFTLDELRQAYGQPLPTPEDVHEEERNKEIRKWNNISEENNFSSKEAPPPYNILEVAENTEVPPGNDMSGSHNTETKKKASGSEIGLEQEVNPISPELLLKLNRLEELATRLGRFAEVKETQEGAREEMEKIRSEIFEYQEEFRKIPEMQGILPYANPNDREAIKTYKSFFRKGATPEARKKREALTEEEKQSYFAARGRERHFLATLKRNQINPQSGVVLYEGITDMGMWAKKLLQEQKIYNPEKSPSTRRLLEFFRIARNDTETGKTKSKKQLLSDLDEAIKLHNIVPPAFPERNINLATPQNVEMKPEAAQEEGEKKDEAVETVSVESNPEAPTSEESGALAVLAIEQLREEVTAEAVDQPLEAPESGIIEEEKEPSLDAQGEIMPPLVENTPETTNLGKTEITAEVPHSEVAEVSVVETKDEKTTEKTSESLSFRVVEKFTKEFNIAPEDLQKIEGFGNLSEGKQLLVLENLRQVTLGRTYEEANDTYKKQLEVEKENAKFYGKLWISFREGIGGKLKHVSEAEKSKGKELKQGGLALHEEVLSELVERVADKRAPDVVLDAKGEIEVLFANSEGLRPVETAVVQGFNKAASTFSKIPYEWSLGTAGPIERKVYRDAQKIYDKEKRSLWNMQGERGTPKDELIQYMAGIEGNIMAERFISTHPDAAKELSKIENQSGFLAMVKKKSTERGLYFLGGMVSRAAFTGVLSVAALPVTAAVTGSISGALRARNALNERDAAARRGVKDVSDEAKNVVSAESMADKLQLALEKLDHHDQAQLRLRFENEQPGYKHTREQLVESLNQRVLYLEQKLKEGRVDFGTADSRLYNQYELAVKLAEAKGFADKHINQELNTRLERMLSGKEKEITKARLAYYGKEIWRSAKFGAIFSALGVGGTEVLRTTLGGHQILGDIRGFEGDSRSVHSLDNTLRGAQSPGNTLKLAESAATPPHVAQVQGLQEYMKAESAADKAAIAQSMGLSVDEAEARAALLKDGEIPVAGGEKAPEVDVTSEVQSANITDAAARRVEIAMDKELQSLYPNDPDKAHELAGNYKAYLANPTKHAEIAQEIGLSQQEIEAKIQGILQKSPGGSASGEAVVGTHTVVQGENLTHILLEKSPGIHLINELGGENGRHEAERTIQNLIRHLEKLSAEELKKIIPSGDVNLIRPGDQINLDALEASIGKVSPVGPSHVGAEVVGNGSGERVVAESVTPTPHESTVPAPLSEASPRATSEMMVLKSLSPEDARALERLIGRPLYGTEPHVVQSLKELLPLAQSEAEKQNIFAALNHLQREMQNVKDGPLTLPQMQRILHEYNGLDAKVKFTETPSSTPVEHYDDSVIKSNTTDQEGGQFINVGMKAELPPPQPGTPEFAEKMSGLWAKSAHEGIYKNAHWGEVRNLSIKEIFTSHSPNHDPSLLQDGSARAARLQMENLVDKAHMMGFQATSGDEPAGAFLDRVAKELGEPLMPTRVAERSTALFGIVEKTFPYIQKNETAQGAFAPTLSERIWENTGIAPARGESTEVYAERAIAQTLEKRPTLHADTLLKRDMTFAGKPIIEGSTPGQVAAQQVFFNVPVKELMDPNYKIPSGMSGDEVVKLRTRIGQMEQMHMVPGERESAGDFLRRSLRGMGRGGLRTEIAPHSPSEYSNGTRATSDIYPEKSAGNSIHQPETVSGRSGGERTRLTETNPAEYASVSDSKLEILSTRHENNLARIDMQEAQRVDAIKANYQNRMEQIAMNKEQQAMNQNMGTVQRGVGQLPNILNGGGGLDQVIQQEVTGRIQGSATANLQESQAIRQAQMNYESEMRTTQRTFEQMRANETMNYEIQTKEIEQQAAQQNQRQQSGARLSR
jgi:hypothetical protein